MTSERSYGPDEKQISAPNTPEGMTPERESAASRGTHFSLSEMRQEMDKLWESVMAGRFPRLASVHSMPALDVLERDGKILVRADLPGLSQDEVTVEVDADGVLISGEKRDERELKEENYFRSERTHGKFTRRISVPPRADIENASAIFKNGVLEIEMPMRPEPEKKRIDVRSQTG